MRLGADGYVVKPFSPADVVRVDAVLRRVDTVPDDQPPLRFGALEIVPSARRVFVDGRPAELTVREYELLSFLVRHPGRAFTRNELMDHVWQYAIYTDTSTVTVHIRRLRASSSQIPRSLAGSKPCGASATDPRRDTALPHPAGIRRRRDDVADIACRHLLRGP